MTDLIYIGTGFTAIGALALLAALVYGITWVAGLAFGGTTGNGTRYCRTCGFAGCPGAQTGDCPRWPARWDACMHGMPDICGLCGSRPAS